MGDGIDVVIGADVQIFTSGSGNWTKPSWATADSLVRVILFGAGGGGGGGDRVASGACCPGAGGGGGGGRREMVFKASDLGATEPYSVGAGGTSGAAGTGSNGSNGGVGGSSTF